MAGSKKLSVGDFVNDRQPEMADETENGKMSAKNDHIWLSDVVAVAWAHFYRARRGRKPQDLPLKS